MTGKSKNKGLKLNWSDVSVWHYLFFLLWPFGALIYALKKIRFRQSAVLILLFCVFLGYNFIFGGSTGGSDSARYVEYLQQQHDNPVSFTEMVQTAYSAEGKLDIYQPIVTWIIAVFTANARVLFAVYALVFGYFMVKCLFILFNEIDYKLYLGSSIILLAFFLLNPIWRINGVRMWTAAEVFVFGLLQVFILKKKNGFIWLLITPLIHVSFLLPVVISVTYLFIPRNVTALFYIFLFVAFFSELNLDLFRGLIQNLPPLLQDRFASYASQDYIEKMQGERSNFVAYVGLFRKAFTYATYVFLIFMFVYRKFFEERVPYFRKLFAFALYYVIFAQLLKQVPSGGRFSTIQQMLFLSLFLVTIFRYKTFKKFRIPYIFCLVGISAWMLLKIRMGFDFMSFFTVFGNPITSIFVNDQTPLIELVKSVL